MRGDKTWRKRAVCFRMVQAGLAGAWGLTASQPAWASEPHGWEKGDVVVSAGVTVTIFSSSADIKLAGTPVTGGNVKLSSSALLSGSVEYFLTRRFSVALVAGIPPQTKVTGTGTLAQLGELGRVRYGLGTLVARYHFNASGRLSPYVGAGVSRFMVFGTKDGSISDLESDDAWAPVVQGGVDYHLNRHIGLAFIATYIPVKTKARGTLNGLPITANATLRSTVLKAAVAYRF